MNEIVKAKIHCLQLAYESAIKHMGQVSVDVDPLHNMWKEICHDISKNEIIAGASGYPTCGRTIEKWNIEYCKHKFFLRNGHSP